MARDISGRQFSLIGSLTLECDEAGNIIPGGYNFRNVQESGFGSLPAPQAGWAPGVR